MKVATPIIIAACFVAILCTFMWANLKAWDRRMGVDSHYSGKR